MTALWWVRRDARLYDNPALLDAQAEGTTSAVFAWTPALHAWSGRRIAHLARCLWSLREDTDGALGVRRGVAADVVLATAREHDSAVVHAAREFTPSGMREQVAVARALSADGRELRLTGSAYAVPPGSVVKADGTEYQVFTPFSRAWRDHGWEPAARRAEPAAFVTTASDVSLDVYAAHGDAQDLLASQMEFRESRWLDRLADFIDHKLVDYPTDRDRPDRDATSHLSVPLAFGQIHPRTILAVTGTIPGPAARKFEAELAWREFHADVLYRHPRALRESLRTVILDDDWETGPEADAAFIAWREGRTGYPLVDAGMRELQATGTMHNRVRMVTASFLVKDLHLPWQRGAAYFRRALLDFDHAQNQLNWQWVAGTGRDAAPYFRIFNPTAQQQKFDPHRAYVERWVAEVDTPAYARPIVDHAEARAVSLAAFSRARGAGS